ncbi:MAG: hypothetical protein K2G51_03335 [Lachnospiraceae bacterium]|nr:hypothetical protein [Lachnospiraceae bacterium]
MKRGRLTVFFHCVHVDADVKRQTGRRTILQEYYIGGVRAGRGISA